MSSSSSMTNHPYHHKVFTTTTTLAHHQHQHWWLSWWAQGTYSDIYIGQHYDPRNPTRCGNDRVAIKLMKKGQSLEHLYSEARVLRALSNTGCVCRIYHDPLANTNGADSDINTSVINEHDGQLKELALPQPPYIAMSMLIANISEFRKKVSLSKLACYELFYLMTESLIKMQRKGFLHRDIKPSNFGLAYYDSANDRITVNNPTNAYTLRTYIFDFGQSVQYSNDSGAARFPTSMAGKSLYASVSRHETRPQGLSDDFIMLLYVMIDFLCGPLPWNNLYENRSSTEDRQQWTREMIAGKTQFVESPPTDVPPPLVKLLASLSSLSPDTVPDYDAILSTLSELKESEKKRSAENQLNELTLTELIEQYKATDSEWRRKFTDKPTLSIKKEKDAAKTLTTEIDRSKMVSSRLAMRSLYEYDGSRQAIALSPDGEAFVTNPAVDSVLSYYHLSRTPARVHSINQALSYCGAIDDLRSDALRALLERFDHRLIVWQQPAINANEDDSFLETPDDVRQALSVYVAVSTTPQSVPVDLLALVLDRFVVQCDAEPALRLRTENTSDVIARVLSSIVDGYRSCQHEREVSAKLRQHLQSRRLIRPCETRVDLPDPDKPAYEPLLRQQQRALCKDWAVEFERQKQKLKILQMQQLQSQSSSISQETANWTTVNSWATVLSKPKPAKAKPAIVRPSLQPQPVAAPEPPAIDASKLAGLSSPLDSSSAAAARNRLTQSAQSAAKTSRPSLASEHKKDAEDLRKQRAPVSADILKLAKNRKVQSLTDADQSLVAASFKQSDRKEDLKKSVKKEEVRVKQEPVMKVKKEVINGKPDSAKKSSTVTVKKELKQEPVDSESKTTSADEDEDADAAVAAALKNKNKVRERTVKKEPAEPKRERLSRGHPAVKYEEPSSDVEPVEEEAETEMKVKKKEPKVKPESDSAAKPKKGRSRSSKGTAEPVMEDLDASKELVATISTDETVEAKPESEPKPKATTKDKAKGKAGAEPSAATAPAAAAAVIASGTTGGTGAISIQRQFYDGKVASILNRIREYENSDVGPVYRSWHSEFQLREKVHVLSEGVWYNGVVVKVEKTPQFIERMQDEAHETGDSLDASEYSDWDLPIGIRMFARDYSDRFQLPANQRYCYEVAWMGSYAGEPPLYFAEPTIRHGWNKGHVSEPNARAILGPLPADADKQGKNVPPQVRTALDAAEQWEITDFEDDPNATPEELQGLAARDENVAGHDEYEKEQMEESDAPMAVAEVSEPSVVAEDLSDEAAVSLVPAPLEDMDISDENSSVAASAAAAPAPEPTPAPAALHEKPKPKPAKRRRILEDSDDENENKEAEKLTKASASVGPVPTEEANEQEQANDKSSESANAGDVTTPAAAAVAADEPAASEAVSAPSVEPLPQPVSVEEKPKPRRKRKLLADDEEDEEEAEQEPAAAATATPTAHPAPTTATTAEDVAMKDASDTDAANVGDETSEESKAALPPVDTSHSDNDPHHDNEIAEQSAVISPTAAAANTHRTLAARIPKKGSRSVVRSPVVSKPSSLLKRTVDTQRANDTASPAEQSPSESVSTASTPTRARRSRRSELDTLGSVADVPVLSRRESLKLKETETKQEAVKAAEPPAKRKRR